MLVEIDLFQKSKGFNIYYLMITFIFIPDPVLRGAPAPSFPNWSPNALIFK